MGIRCFGESKPTTNTQEPGSIISSLRLQQNKNISSERVVNEHIIGMVKRFKIVSDKYRNRRKRFCLRFNLIAGICNYEL